MSLLFDHKSRVHVDQYDGTASKVWDLYIGDHQRRTSIYKDWLCKLLREHGCQTILDAAAGTGPDSLMLLQEGFTVTSVDFSDHMLNKARELRWEHRKHPNIDDWTIVQANWLSLEADLKSKTEQAGLYDAIILFGNSFTHLPNEDGKLTFQRMAMKNFNAVLKPGGLLILDHRNYDAVKEGKRCVTKSSYYHSDRIENVDTYLVSKNGCFNLLILDIFINAAAENETKDVKNFSMYLYPLALREMKSLIKDHFIPKSHEVLGDFKPLVKDEEPGYYCHIAIKK